MAHVIGLIQCSKQKLEMTCAAREMYSASQLFKKSLAYAERRCSQIYVLSAFHGLVELDQVIGPYNLRLSEREAVGWAQRIAQRLAERHGRNPGYLILAGADYAEPLTRALRTQDGYRNGRWRGAVDIVLPLAGMTIGARLHYLNECRDVT